MGEVGDAARRGEGWHSRQKGSRGRRWVLSGAVGRLGSAYGVGAVPLPCAPHRDH